MADDETTDATESVDATEETTAPKQRGAGVHVPGWALGALVVVAALLCGGVGYAIGHSGNDSLNLQSPIANVRSAPDEQGGQGGECPRPMGPRDGRGRGGELPGGPGFDGPMGPLGPGNGPGIRGNDDQNQEQSPDDQGNDQNGDNTSI
jgi:hypothetical protein